MFYTGYDKGVLTELVSGKTPQTTEMWNKINLDTDAVQNQQIWIWNTSLKWIQIWKHA